MAMMLPAEENRMVAEDRTWVALIRTLWEHMRKNLYG